VLTRDTGPLPQAFISLTAPQVYRIRAQSFTPAGARFVREAIVSFGDVQRQEATILRWYRGDGGAGATSISPPPC
jgi:hypothetical protein